jgi:hypothetical protein
MNRKPFTQDAHHSLQRPHILPTLVYPAHDDNSCHVRAFEVRTPRPAPDQPGKTVDLRPGQLDAFNKLRSRQFGVLNAPTGWGKSVVLCALAADDLLSRPKRKIVVCIPQTIIAKGFVGTISLKLPNGTDLKWQVNNDLCSPNPSKVQRLLQFLRSPARPALADRIVVVTHIGLASAFGRLTPDEQASAIQNTTFVFDEAHHIQASDEAANRLGSILTFVVESGDPSARVLLSTAFFFRGDRLPILDDRLIRKFHRHSIAFDEYWRSLTYLESYRYDFVVFSGSVWEELEKLLAHSQEPTIIYVPREGHPLLRGKSKAEFTGRVLELLHRHFGARQWRPQGNSSGKLVLDLVDPSHRADKVRFAMRHGDRIAAIVTVGMFREGADWVQAQRVIDLMPTGSDQDRNQRFGRLIRDTPGKKCVRYYSFFPRMSSREEEQRRNLSKLFAHFHASLVLENALVPIRVPVERSRRGPRGEEDENQINLLGQFDAQTQEQILDECTEALLGLTTAASSGAGPVDHAEVLEEIGSVLARFDIHEHVEPLAKQIVLILRRRGNLSLPVDDLVEAGFDKVWAEDALEGLRLYSAGFGGPATFQEIRRAVHTVFEERWFEMFGQVRELPVAPPRCSRASWWVHYNQALHLRGDLSAERVQLLEGIPWWTWREGVESRFRRQYEAIKLLPKCPEPADPLYVFVMAMRGRYRLGKLSRDRIALLEAIPWWTWRSRSSFEELCQEAASLDEEPDAGSRLGQWVWRTRDRFGKGKLSEEEIRQVESIPWWSWKPPSETTWDRNYEMLAALPAPPQHREQPKEYKFAYAQRAKYKAGKLTPVQAALFEKIGWWKW